MKQIGGTNQTYSAFQDQRLWNVAKEFCLYGLIFILSGFATKALVDYFVTDDASKISDNKFQKKMQINKTYINEGVYKNKDEIQSEFEFIKAVTPTQISNKLFFQKNKTFFL